MNTKSFQLQLAIIAGFLLFFYMFFALATSIYRDYKLEGQIESFQAQIDELALRASQKPGDVKYYESPQYKDRYAKENLNLLKPGEKLIIIPSAENVIRRSPERPVETRTLQSTILALPNRTQWYEYFFGKTLSISPLVKPKAPENTPPPLDERSPEGTNLEQS